MKVLGNININGEDKILAVQKRGELYEYVIDNEVIGAFDPKIMADTLIVFKENTLENELSGQIKDEITQIIEESGKEEIMQTKPENELEKNLGEGNMGYQSSLGNEESKATMVKEEEVEKKKTIGEDDRNKDDKKITGDVQIIQEIELNQMVSPNYSLGDVLKEEGIVDGDINNAKLGIVYSRDIANQGIENTTEFSVVLIKDGNNIEILDLETDGLSGSNPNEADYKVSGDETVTKETVDTRFQLDKNGEKTLSIKNGESGQIKAYYSDGRSREDNDVVDMELETQDTVNFPSGQTNDVRNLAPDNENRDKNVEKMLGEIKSHEDEQEELIGDKTTVESIDGDKETVNKKTEELVKQEIVEHLCKNEQITNVFTEKEITEMVSNYWEKLKNEGEPKNFDELIEEIESLIEKDAINMDRTRNH